MYSRSYYPEEQAIRIPEGYDGTALYEKESVEQAKPSAKIEPQKNEVKFSPKDEITAEQESEEVFLRTEKESGGIFPKIDLGNICGGLFSKNPSVKSFIPNIGTEEILIIGLALFLFFSKSGDRECALLVLALLFIN